MYRIIDNRGSGKTSRLMLLAKENGGILVCSNPRAMRAKAMAYGLTGFEIISYEDFLEHRFKDNANCFIDELELFLSHLTRNKIMGYSLSLED